jgi:hypothetical protein
MPTAASLSTILGLGYSGAANLDGRWLMLTASSAQEDDNLIKSAGSISNRIPSAAGEVPVRNRRALNLSLTCNLTAEAVSLAHENTFDWRLAGLNGKPSSLTVYLANGEGYAADEAYVQAATLSAPEGGLGTCTFSVIAYRWNDLSAATGTPRSQARFIPFGSALYQPIPHWMTSVDHPGHPGVPLSWSLSLNNGYSFYQLCETTPYPPTPRAVVPGQVVADLNLTTLAFPGSRPGETAVNVAVRIGGGTTAGVAVPLTVFNIPLMYRDPARSAQGFGDQNAPIKWQASWKALGAVPVAA